MGRGNKGGHFQNFLSISQWYDKSNINRDFNTITKLYRKDIRNMAEEVPCMLMEQDWRKETGLLYSAVLDNIAETSETMVCFVFGQPMYTVMKVVFLMMKI